MSPLTISIIVFACVLGGGLLGVFLHGLLPDHHLSPETKEVVRLRMGLGENIVIRTLVNP